MTVDPRADRGTQVHQTKFNHSRPRFSYPESSVALDFIWRARVGIAVGSVARQSALSPEKILEVESEGIYLYDAKRSALSSSILCLAVGVLCLLQICHFAALRLIRPGLWKVQHANYSATIHYIQFFELIFRWASRLASQARARLLLLLQTARPKPPRASQLACQGPPTCTAPLPRTCSAQRRGYPRRTNGGLCVRPHCQGCARRSAVRDQWPSCTAPSPRT